MDAIRRAPWSLRVYAGLIGAIAILAAHTNGRGQSWTGVLWGAVCGIAVCTGNRAIWWLLVAWNAYLLVVFPILLGGSWSAMAFGLIGLALLLAPGSRRYVFERGSEPTPASDG